MRARTLIGAAAGLLIVAVGANAQILFQDNFESYADEAAFHAAGAWGDLSSGAAPAVLLPPPNGHPGQGVFSSGGAAAIHQFPETPVITDAKRLVIEYDYWDYDVADARITMGLRHSGGNSVGAFFELGEYNSSDPSVLGGNDAMTQGYSVRTVFATPPTNTPANQSWFLITPSKLVGVGGWHHFKLEIGETFATASVNVDTDVDGTLDSLHSITIPLTTHVGKKYDHVRWGGPSNLSSTGSGGADNLVIYMVPEPATLALLLLGGMPLLRRRRA